MRNRIISVDPIEILQEIFFSLETDKFHKREWCLNDAKILEVAARTIRDALQQSNPPDTKSVCR